MSVAPDLQRAGGPASVRKRSRFYVVVAGIGITIALLMAVGLWALSRSLPNPSALPSGAPAGPSVEQPAGQPASPVPVPVPELPAFGSTSEQVAVFYAPGSLASRHIAATYGGDSLRGRQGFSDYDVIRYFNYWWRVGCESPTQWSQILVGIVDARSQFYQANQTPPSGTCSAYFNNSAGQDAEGRTREITVSAGIGDRQSYYFLFTQDMSRSDGTGLWLLTDRDKVRN